MVKHFTAVCADRGVATEQRNRYARGLRNMPILDAIRNDKDRPKAGIMMASP